MIVTEKILIPVHLAVVVIGGGTIWLTTIWLKTEAHSETLSRVEVKLNAVETIDGKINEIRERLVRIETILKEVRKWPKE